MKKLILTLFVALAATSSLSAQAAGLYPGSNSGGLILGISVLVAILIFLVLREFWCWYFKTNEQIRILREIRDELRRSNGGAEPLPNGVESEIGGLAGAARQLRSLAPKKE